MPHKAVFDIETMSPWQKDLVTGFRKGEMTIMMASRHSGKSQVAAFTRLWQDIFEADKPITDIVLNTGTVYGSRYHTAEPIGGSWVEMEAWCFETFGNCGDKDKIWGEIKAPEPEARWYMNNRKFWFKNKKDLDWFLMRWRS